jgi:hypothetical protein
VEGVNLACVRATPARAAQGGRQLKRIVVDHWGLVDGGVAVVFGHKLGSSNLVLHRRARAGAQTLCGRPNFTPNHAPPAHQPDGPAPPERRLDGPLQPGPTLSASPPLHVLDVDRGFAMFAAQQFGQVPGGRAAVHQARNREASLACAARFGLADVERTKAEDTDADTIANMRCLTLSEPRRREPGLLRAPAS